ncbi:hypothetical protein EJ03DRAFT_21786 [Teratosphaeria nubilosa]|uniref:Uncharacterized protein n=1 Tax=Teratosphaeria nubilosa TaxID=161662 RepID=A0A6G1LFP2_9PEZI|nr:hypothetical protein EJ03DRAFT_21786 [Teratosphaeria nubilosa]
MERSPLFQASFTLPFSTLMRNAPAVQSSTASIWPLERCITGAHDTLSEICDAVAYMLATLLVLQTCGVVSFGITERAKKEKLRTKIEGDPAISGFFESAQVIHGRVWLENHCRTCDFAWSSVSTTTSDVLIKEGTPTWRHGRMRHKISPASQVHASRA